MIRTILLATLVAGTPAMVSAAETTEAELSSLAESSVSAHLKDPYSAKITVQFANVEKGVVCGTVNAKNSYGGYVGTRRWAFSNGAARGRKDVVMIENPGSQDGQDIAANAMVPAMCDSFDPAKQESKAAAH